MSNNLLKLRIKKLVESKSNKFKRKYFLLSSLALNESIKDNDIFSKASCYLDNIISSNGLYPNEDSILNLYKESLSKDNINKSKIDKNVKYITNYLNILYSNKSNLIESIIDEELSFISRDNKRLNLKLKETMIESFKRNSSLFLESDDLKTYSSDPEARKRQMAAQEELLFGKKSKVKTSDILGDEVEEPEEKVTSKRGANAIISKYSQLFLVKNIKNIRDRLKIYIPLNFTQEQMDKLPVKDKLAIIAKYDLVVKKKVTNSDLRKLEILFLVDYYLNIKQKLMSGAAYQQLSADLNSYDDVSSLWNMMGGKKIDKDTLLKIKKFKGSEKYINDPIIKKKLIQIRNSFIDKMVFAEDRIDMSAVSEKSLFDLLSACLNRDDKRFFSKSQVIDGEVVEDKTGEDLISVIKRDLNIMFPTPSKEESDKFIGMSDSEYQEYLDLTRQRDEELKQEEQEEMASDPSFLSAEEAEKAETDKRFIPKKEIKYKTKKVYRKSKSTGEYILDAQGNKKVFDEEVVDDQGNKIVIGYKKVYDPNGNLVGNFEFEEPVLDLSSELQTSGKTKTQRRKSDVNRLIDKAASPALMAYFMKKYEKVGKPLSYSEIAAQSLGRFRDAPGARQATNKSWFNALFFNTSFDKKAEIYTILVKRYIDILQKKDMFKNMSGERPKIPKSFDVKSATERLGKDITKDDISAYFSDDFSYVQSIEELISKKDFEEYFSGELFEKGASDLDADLKEDLITYFLHDKSLFRHFSANLMKDFYTKEVWSKLETNLAHAVVEYFNSIEKFKKNNIGYSLPAGKKSSSVKTIEGKDLFNSIIYWVMERTAVKTKVAGVYTPGQDDQFRKDKFKSGFAKKVKTFNEKINSHNSKLIQSSGESLVPMFDFDESDFEKLHADMSSDTGIIGSVYANARKLDNRTYDDFIKWIGKKSDDQLSIYVNISMAHSFYNKEGFILDIKEDQNGDEKFVLIKKDDPSEIHLISPKEETMLSNIAKYNKDVVGIDMDAYKAQAESKYKNKMSEEERNSWIERAEEVNYWDGEKLNLSAEVMDVSDDLLKVDILIDPDSDNPISKTVDVMDCTQV
tara:strand:+ start:2633 stop:5872 length:3240 start_codon:yes stop_codon:yes gene_type:complete